MFQLPYRTLELLSLQGDQDDPARRRRRDNL